MVESKTIKLDVPDLAHLSLSLHTVYHTVIVHYEEEQKLICLDKKHQTDRFTPFSPSRQISKTFSKQTIQNEPR